MSHQQLQDRLEEYAQNQLSSETLRELEQHVAACRECQDRLEMLRLTRGIVRAARLENSPSPAPGFVHSVILATQQQKDSYFFWSPLRLVAVRAVPVMALMALILGLIAYVEMSTILNARETPRQPLLESSLGLSSNWGRDVAVLSETLSRDKDRVVTTLMEGQISPYDRERGR